MFPAKIYGLNLFLKLIQISKIFDGFICVNPCASVAKIIFFQKK